MFFGIIVFLWALKSGQFKEQDRARYLAIEDKREKPDKVASRYGKLQLYMLFGFIILGIVISASVVVYAYFI